MNERLRLRRPDWAKLEKDRRVEIDSAMQWCGLTPDSWRWFQETTNITDYDSQVARLPDILATIPVGNPNLNEVLTLLGGNQLAFLTLTTDPVAVFSLRELTEEYARAVEEGRLGDYYEEGDAIETWGHEVAHLEQSFRFGIRAFIVFATITGGNYDRHRGAVTLQNISDLHKQVRNGSNLSYLFGRILAAPALANVYNYHSENELAAKLLSAAKRQGVALTNEEEEFTSVYKEPEALDLTAGVFVNQD